MDAFDRADWKALDKKEAILTRELIDFLDAHEFGSFDLGDIDYLSDKIDNYFEFIDEEISIHSSIKLAEEYSLLKLNK